MKKTGVSVEMAFRLSKAFGSSPETWLGMQMALICGGYETARIAYQLSDSRRSSWDSLDPIHVADVLPVLVSTNFRKQNGDRVRPRYT